MLELGCLNVKINQTFNIDSRDWSTMEYFERFHAKTFIFEKNLLKLCILLNKIESLQHRKSIFVENYLEIIQVLEVFSNIWTTFHCVWLVWKPTRPNRHRLRGYNHRSNNQWGESIKEGPGFFVIRNQVTWPCCCDLMVWKSGPDWSLSSSDEVILFDILDILADDF